MKTIAAILCLTLTACGARVETSGTDITTQDDDAGATPDAVTYEADADTQDARSDTCVETPRTQALCWGDKPWLTPRDLRGKRTSVDYTACSDDGSVFVDSVHANGGNCWRPSDINPSAPVWCCVYP